MINDLFDQKWFENPVQVAVVEADGEGVKQVRSALKTVEPKKWTLVNHKGSELGITGDEGRK